MSTWFVYVVRCKDRSLYTGISTDVEQRIRRNNKGKEDSFLPTVSVTAPVQEAPYPPEGHTQGQTYGCHIQDL